MVITQNTECEFGHSLTHWFQPIYHLKNNKAIGYEALLRDSSQLEDSPINIFLEAHKNGYRNILDLMSVKAAFTAFKDETPLFINVFPSTLLEKNFLSWWDSNMPLMRPIVLELLENEPIWNWKDLKIIVRELHKKGVKIAIDDMGTGYSFFQQWIELEPSFIKLDRYFAENLSTNYRKQNTIKSLIDLFSDTTEIIIEGIETKEDLEIAEQLGILYAQGYFLGKPAPTVENMELYRDNK
ncbi:EAL domain-containing protein [Oxobacter pfennigii]|nr:EAL domain-containing protein [Oxobacter pfennigii]